MKIHEMTIGRRVYMTLPSEQTVHGVVTDICDGTEPVAVVCLGSVTVRVDAHEAGLFQPECEPAIERPPAPEVAIVRSGG